jgi:hypothetical protein
MSARHRAKANFAADACGGSCSASPARPERAKPFHDLVVPDCQLIRGLPEPALLGLRCVTLNAMSWLSDARNQAGVIGTTASRHRSMTKARV